MELTTPGAKTRKLPLSPVGAVFFCALLVRLWVLLQITGTPHFLPNQGDMKFYSDWARRIASGVWTDHQAFYGLPLYPYLVGGIYWLLGYQPYAVILLQVIAEALTCLVIYRLTIQVCRSGGNDAGRGLPVEAVGAAAAAGWMFFTPAQAYSSILMPSAFLVLAYWSTIWWVVRPREKAPRLLAFFVLGLLMGFVAMMVANILFLAPLVVAAIFLHRAWTAWRPPVLARRGGAAALLFVGIFIGASPCWIHNYFVAREPVFLSAHSGLNFWLGNNAEATGYPRIPNGLRADQEGMLKDSILWAEKAVGHPLRHAEVSAFWSAKAHDYIHEHPGQWLKLLATKFGNFWNAFQYDDLGIIMSLQDDGVLLPGLSFGWIAVFALPGMVLAAWRRPGARWVLAAVALHLASLMTVFITERYRLASVPGLLILAAVGLAELWREINVRRWQPVAAYAGLLLAAILFVNRPVDPSLENVAEYNAAVADMEQGRYDRAEPRLEKVFKSTPDNAATNFALGNLWLAKGDHDKARGYYLRTLQLDSQQKQVFNNLSVMAMQEKRWPLAERLLVNCLQISPDDAKAAFLLAKVRCVQENYPGARLALADAMRLQPNSEECRRLDEELKTKP